jgi:hypothetical protein
MRASVTLPLLGAAAVTVGALVLQLARKPAAEPPPQLDERVEGDAERSLLERLRTQGL